MPVNKKEKDHLGDLHHTDSSGGLGLPPLPQDAGMMPPAASAAPTEAPTPASPDPQAPASPTEAPVAAPPAPEATPSIPEQTPQAPEIPTPAPEQPSKEEPPDILDVLEVPEVPTYGPQETPDPAPEAPSPMAQPTETPTPEPPPPSPETQATPDQQEAQPAVMQVETPSAAEIQPTGVKAKKKKKAAVAAAPQDDSQKTKTRQEIEEVLSEGLSELYQTMTPQEQEQFRKKGELAATSIEQMVTSFKATAKKVIEVIRGWLSTIPRVNKYFLEQESKLKTDEIMKLQRRYKKDQRLKKIRME